MKAGFISFAGIGFFDFSELRDSVRDYFSPVLSVLEVPASTLPVFVAGTD